MKDADLIRALDQYLDSLYRRGVREPDEVKQALAEFMEVMNDQTW